SAIDAEAIEGAGTGILEPQREVAVVVGAHDSGLGRQPDQQLDSLVIGRPNAEIDPALRVALGPRGKASYHNRLLLLDVVLDVPSSIVDVATGALHRAFVRAGAQSKQRKIPEQQRGRDPASRRLRHKLVLPE